MPRRNLCYRTLYFFYHSYHIYIHTYFKIMEQLLYVGGWDAKVFSKKFSVQNWCICPGFECPSFHVEIGFFFLHNESLLFYHVNGSLVREISTQHQVWFDDVIVKNPQKPFWKAYLGPSIPFYDVLNTTKFRKTGLFKFFNLEGWKISTRSQEKGVKMREFSVLWHYIQILYLLCSLREDLNHYIKDVCNWPCSVIYPSSAFDISNIWVR